MSDLLAAVAVPDTGKICASAGSFGAHFADVAILITLVYPG
jgi:hypothetical protein